MLRFDPMRSVVVFLGCFPNEAEASAVRAAEFGWSLESAPTLADLRKLNESSHVIAVFFDAETVGLSWPQALDSVRDIAPSALPIACQKFSDKLPWPALAAAGMFHTVPRPFKAGEVRQSLGFVWQAILRRSQALLSLSSVSCA